MGFPMARRLIEAGHSLIVFDTQKAAMDRLVALGARPAASVKRCRRRGRDRDGEPALAAGLARCRNRRGRRDRGQEGQALHRSSTVGSQMAVQIYGLLAGKNIVQIDSPVSGGVGGAEKGTLAVMVSGPRAEFETMKAALGVIGKVFFIGEKPGSGQTMKLANNFLSATAMVATSEAVVMGVKSGSIPP